MTVELFPTEIKDRATLERCMKVHGPLTLARRNLYAQARYWCGSAKVSRDLVGELCRLRLLRLILKTPDDADVLAVLELTEQPPVPDAPANAITGEREPKYEP